MRKSTLTFLLMNIVFMLLLIGQVNAQQRSSVIVIMTDEQGNNYGF
ncbi:hypothetical protein [Colwellia piezophila]|nr:hypothetical protein [Colwellia piezophila]